VPRGTLESVSIKKGNIMHRAIIEKPFEWQIDLKSGEYWLEDHNSAELLWASRGFGDCKLVETNRPQVHSRDWKAGDEVLFVRVGGFGDLIWMNSIYQELRETRGIKVAHCCFERYAPVLDGFVDRVVPYPLSAETADIYLDGRLVWLENVIEKRECVDGEHPTDRIRLFLGLPRSEKRNAYLLKDEEKKWAREKWPRNGKSRIAVQLASSTPIKNYRHLPATLGLLNRKGYELVLIGGKRDPEELPDGVMDGTQLGWTVRESIAMAGECDVVLGADSFLLHVADALGIPAVGLFGDFHGESYMKGYKGEPIQGTDNCSPCSWHPRGNAFPPFCPSKERGFCLALAKRSPEYIVTVVERYL